MSADNWAICPWCAERAFIDPDDWDGIEESLPEYYEIWLNRKSGNLEVSYGTECRNPDCDFKLGFNHSVPIPVTPNPPLYNPHHLQEIIGG